jgi:16S rRNA G527 N7-methylase RsmG
MIENQIDWNEVWKEQMTKHNEMNGGMDCASYWADEEEARNYWKMLKGENDLIENLILGMKIDSTSRVLDIGAGPGTLALPFSKKAAHVTAVEPSASMASVLRGNIEEYGINNIDCVQKRWEEVDIERDLKAPYDMVIASFSLGMTDIKAAIQKMMEASSKYVYLAWFAGEPSWDGHYRELSSILYGNVAYHPMPKSDVLFNLLYQMSIYPNVRVFPFEMFHRFPSFEDAVDYFGGQFRATTDNQKSALRDNLPQILEKDGDSWALRHYSLNMMIWWENNRQRM